MKWNNRKYGALLLLIVMVVVALKSDVGGFMLDFSGYLHQKPSDTENAEAITIDSLEERFASEMPGQQKLIDLNGLMARKLGMQSYFGNIGIYVTKDRYIVPAYSSTKTDYEFEQTLSLYQFLREHGIHFLYVNEPTKYLEDDYIIQNFGMESYSNRNADRLLERLSSAGIPALDLREAMAEEGKSSFAMFYRTDHHWTVPAGLWASKQIAGGLNDFCGYHIDTSLFDEQNYLKTEYKSCWLGEQGRKVAEAYVGLDDYVELKPDFPTSFSFKNADGSLTQGTFDAFVDESVYNTENNVYENPSWHYAYKRLNCINNDVEQGKVLLLGDSFDHVTVPFLALGIHELDSLILRNTDEQFKLREYILENEYDTVIVCYAQLMIGSHDNSINANYKMYDFDTGFSAKATS